MKNVLVFAIASATVATLPAQGNPLSLKTSTDYGVYARAANGNVNGVARGTQIPATGLSITASDRSITGSVATAGTKVSLVRVSSTVTPVLNVSEAGSAAVRSPRDQASAGTSKNHRRPDPGPHGLSWRVPTPLGARAKVTVSWSGKASRGASTGCTVDLDGDGRPEFALKVSGGSNSKTSTFNVAAGGGLQFDIVTNGNAVTRTPSSGTAGGEAYSSRLTVSYRLVAPGCTFAAFGAECGGKLTGNSLSSAGSRGVTISLANAAPSAVAVLVIGSPLVTPIPLPGSRCALLVSPRATLPGRTDGSGAASWKFPTLASSLAFQISFQGVTLSFGSAGAKLASSNGLTMTCR